MSACRRAPAAGPNAGRQPHERYEFPRECETHGRDSVGIELNESYARMAGERLRADGLEVTWSVPE